MRTTPRDLRFLLRMAQMILVGIALDVLGMILNPPKET